MPLDTTRAHPKLPADLHDDVREIKERIPRRYVSDWTRVHAGTSATFQHGLQDHPYVTSVLEATDSQGAGATDASSVTITTTDTLVTVANGGTDRFFRVRAF